MQNLSMRQSPTRTSLRDSESHVHHTYTEYPGAIQSIESSNNNSLDDFEFGLHELEGVSGFYNSSGQQYGSANAFNQSYMPNSNSEQQRRVLYPHHGSTTSFQQPIDIDANFLRGIEDCAVLCAPNDGHNEQNRKEPLARKEETLPSGNKPSGSFSIAARSSVPAPMQSPPKSSINTVPETQSRQTRYRPYGELFQSSEEAKRHRQISTRFNRQPYILQSQDSTVASIEAERGRHVERIYNAMTAGTAARDNTGSIAMKRWVHAAHYPANLVEAYAHKVFDCLLAQAKDGFRGWHHNDYVVDDRKGEDEDRDVNCEERLNNIIRALEEEKTICEDVMNSACQIRMFVNAPRAYSNRKHQNRVGNSKRGRTKDPSDSNSRASKIQKTGSRQYRTRVATESDPVSERRISQPLQQSQELNSLPYDVAPSSHHVIPHPLRDFGSPQQDSSKLTPHISFAGQQIDPNLPLPSTTPPFSETFQTNIQMPHSTPMPPPQHSPFLSPPTPSHTTYSTPATPLNTNPNPAMSPWQSNSTPSFTSTHSNETAHPANLLDDVAVSYDWLWLDMKSSHPTNAYSNTNLFETYPGAHDTFTDVAQAVSRVDGIPDFQTLWESQSGVQTFPFSGPSGDAAGH
jgi:hypothetical protein